MKNKTVIEEKWILQSLRLAKMRNKHRSDDPSKHRYNKV